MRKPNKATRKIMAGMVIDAAKEAGITLTVKRSWVELSPPDKASPDFMVDLMACSDEVAELLKKGNP